MDRQWITMRAFALWVIGGLLVAGIGFWRQENLINRISDTQQEILATRSESQKAQCLQYNAEQQVAIAAETGESHDLVNALAAARRANPNDTTVEADVKKFNDQHDALIRMGHPLRDCSPSGIRKFLSKKTSGR